MSKVTPSRPESVIYGCDPQVLPGGMFSTAT